MMDFIIKNKYISLILRIIVGATFITSALLKYLSIDAFDLYIYEHQLFDYQITEILTRLLIAMEFILGIILITGIHVRLAKMGVLLCLTGFTIYLILMPYLFNVDMQNCHCFGEKLPFTRTQSIIKNIILILLTIPINTTISLKTKYQFPILASGIIVILLISFSVNPPSFIYNKIYGQNVEIDENLYQIALENTGQKTNFAQNRQIICLYSTACQYCQKSAKKIDLAIQKEKLNKDQIKIIFWRTENNIPMNNFFKTNKISPLTYTTFTVDTFLNITHGQMPVILFTENGKIQQSYQYIAIDEKKLADFLK